MEYIFNVKAQFEQKKEYNIEAQFEAIKKNIEGQVIHIQAKIDPNSLSLAKIQEQLKNEKLTLNIGNVTFDQSGVDKANKAVGDISNTIENTRTSIDSFGKSIQSVFNNNFGIESYKNSLKSLGLDDETVAKSARAIENLGIQINKVSGSQSNTINQDGIPEQTKKVLIEAVDQYGRLISLSQTFYSDEEKNAITVAKITDNIKAQVQEQEKLNRSLESQSKQYTDISNRVAELVAKQRERNNPIKGVGTDENTGKLIATDQNPTEDLKKYVEAFNKVNTMLSAYQVAVDKGVVVTQTFKNNLSTTISELQRYGENVRKAQTGNKGIVSEVDVKSLVEAAKSELGRFESEVQKSGLETDKFKEKIVNLKQILDQPTMNRQGFTSYTDELRKVKAEYQQIKTDVGSAGDAVKKLQADTAKGLFVNNANDDRVKQIVKDVDNLATQYKELRSQFETQGFTENVRNGFSTLNNDIQQTTKATTELQQSLRSTNTELSLTGQKSNLNNRIETWLKNNTKASGTTVQALKQLQAQIQSADKVSLRNLTQQFKDITKNAELAGEAGKDVLDSINEKVGKFTSWFSISQIIMTITNEAKQAIVTFKEMDTILTEISKTSERSAESLAKLGESAFDAASKYGVSVQNYLTGVQEMARAGYETLGEHQSEQMAELALLVQAAGGVSDSVARDYLIATDAAYQLGGSIEKLTSILDSQNLVTNNYAVSMQDMTEATKEAASIANQYGVSIEELSALIAIAEARTKQGGNVVGNAIKSILLQTQDITNKQVVKAFDTVGISMYKIVDGAKSLKTPIELLKELADVFKALPQGDDRRATILSDIGGMQIYHYVQKCA